MDRMDGARRAAVQAVMRLHRGGWANLTAKSAFASPSLSPRDRAFANALFYGTAERLATLDYVLKPFLNRPLDKLDGEIRAILETGLYQVKFMKVPAHAAVDEAVKLARGMGKSSAAGFVNAVLRKAAGVELSSFTFGSELERVCITYSVGEAVAKEIMAALPAEYDDFFAASFSRALTCLRANTLKISPKELLALLGSRGAEEVREGQVPGSLYARLAGGVLGMPLFENGLYHVQGEASQYACACVGAAPGLRVLDVCAAPGGKTATLAQAMGGGGGLTSCDVRENRLPLIHEALARLGIEGVTVRLNDAAVYDETLAGQNAVLCDVPCSGLGVLATKPDIRYAAGDNFAALPDLQGKILATAARYVKKGGRLVYSTCTVRPQENQQVVRHFLRGHGNFRLVPPPAPPLGAQLDENMVTILPHRTGLDGFFVATLESL